MISVSIVDDEKKLCKSIATFLNGSAGFRCMSIYGSAEAALKHLPTDNPDVVLMDINMSGMDGIECVKQLKMLAPQIQILMLTVYEDTEQIFKALAAGATGYLLKRLEPEELLQAIRDVHSGGSPCPTRLREQYVCISNNRNKRGSRDEPEYRLLQTEWSLDAASNMTPPFPCRPCSGRGSPRILFQYRYGGGISSVGQFLVLGLSSWCDRRVHRCRTCDRRGHRASRNARPSKDLRLALAVLVVVRSIFEVAYSEHQYELHRLHDGFDGCRYRSASRSFLRRKLLHAGP